MDSAFLGNRACKCSVNIITADREGSPSEIDETVPFQRANGVVRSSETAEIEIAVAENFHPRLDALGKVLKPDNSESSASHSAMIVSHHSSLVGFRRVSSSAAVAEFCRWAVDNRLR